MDIAFYCPMKPIDHPIPSGDQRMAKLIISALELAGHRVKIASTLRSYDGIGDDKIQRQIQNFALLEIDQYLQNNNPSIWFTYHLYHKAPDWIGMAVAKKLNIPYIIAEASFAPKQKYCKWALNHQAVLTAIQQSNAIYHLNPNDQNCVDNVINANCRIVKLPPFIEDYQFNSSLNNILLLRQKISTIYNIDHKKPWIIITAMMRNGDKLKSYEIISKSLKNLDISSFEILVCGDGKAAKNIKKLFTNYHNIYFIGLLNRHDLREILYAGDIFIWPGINEAFGLAILEAQAAGLPVVAGDNLGIANMVKNGKSGILTPMGDVDSFAKAIKYLLDNPDVREKMGIFAKDNVKANHNINNAADIFRRTLPTNIDHINND